MFGFTLVFCLLVSSRRSLFFGFGIKKPKKNHGKLVFHQQESFHFFFEMCWNEKRKKIWNKNSFWAQDNSKSYIGEMILFDENTTFSMRFLGCFDSKTKKRPSQGNQQKTKVKPNIHKFWLKPSDVLFRKMFFVFWVFLRLHSVISVLLIIQITCAS